MKNIKTIGLALLACSVINLTINTSASAQDISTNPFVVQQEQIGQLRAEIFVVCTNLNGQIFTANPVQLPNGQIGSRTQLQPGALAKIPEVVSALTGGGITVSSSAPTNMQIAAYLTCIKSLSGPSGDIPTLSNNLALLNAGLAAAH